MTGSLVFFVVSTIWKIPLVYWCVTIVVFLHIAAFLLMRKTLIEKWRLSEELRQLKTPKLSIVFGDAKPYVETVTEVGRKNCRKIRVGVKNNSSVQLHDVCVKLEQCTPGAEEIYLKQRITAVGGVLAPKSLGPNQEQLFDLVTEFVDKKHFEINLDIQILKTLTDKQPREIELSANCAESVPARATFRLEVGPDGFFVMRSVERSRALARQFCA